MTTIRDVARAAGVSVATVSRVMNNNATVDPALRERTLAIARQLRYVPSSAARSLILRRTNTIGVLLPDLFGEYFSELIRGIDLAARKRGLHILLSSSHGNAQEAATAIESMRGLVDGLLLMSPYLDESFLRLNLPDDVNCVLINAHHHKGPHAQVQVDNHGGAYQMTQYLLSLGHRRLGFIAGPERNQEAGERLKGTLAALRAHGIDRLHHIFEGDFTENSGWKAGNELLSLSEKPDAVFAANDIMAIGCMSSLINAGLRVPHDISVAGFDDIPVSRYISPSLSTVKVSIADLGNAALTKLCALLEQQKEPRPDNTRLVMPTDLAVRNSTAARQSFSS